LEPIFRPAQADDAAAIAYLAYLAGQGHARISTYDLIVPGRPGPTAERIYMIKRIVTADAVSMLHYSHHRVAVVDGQAVACAGALDSGGASLLTFIAALKETGWTEEDIGRMRLGVATYNRVEPSVPPGAWAIENVATLPEHRRRGLVDGLLEMLLAEGKVLDHTTAQLAVHIGNDVALKLYERRGFEITAQKTDPEFEALFGSPGMWEMRRGL
jgi:ribosomal protein S18 acetylase RimI-like enzyme